MAQNINRRVLVSNRLSELKSGNAELDSWVAQYLQPFVSQTFEMHNWIVGAGEQYAYKTASTSRNSTTTLTADDDLHIALEAASVYKLELQLLFRGDGATGNQGFNFAMGYSGSFAFEFDALGHKIVNLVPTVHASAVGAFGMSAGPIPGGVAPIAIGALDDDGFHSTWLVETLTAGTLSVNWAQAASSADATVLRAGSYLIATRISQ